MRTPYDFHVHSVFSDGKNTPREMVEAAISYGMETLGFSDHSHTAFDLSWCMQPENISAYRETITALKQEYAGKIELFCGIEQDYDSDEPTDGYDYVIGSVHYMKIEGEYVAVDGSPDILRAAADKYFGSDTYALAAVYFDIVSDVVRKTNCDLIGHFDLIAKYNESAHLFDENDPRYIAAWKKAADKLLLTGKPFELNFGAIYRGRRTVPYPAPAMWDYLISHGARFVLSGDSHCCDALGFTGGKPAPENLPYIDFRTVIKK